MPVYSNCVSKIGMPVPQLLHLSFWKFTQIVPPPKIPLPALPSPIDPIAEGASYSNNIKCNTRAQTRNVLGAVFLWEDDVRDDAPNLAPAESKTGEGSALDVPDDLIYAGETGQQHAIAFMCETGRLRIDSWMGE